MLDYINKEPKYMKTLRATKIFLLKFILQENYKLCSEQNKRHFSWLIDVSNVRNNKIVKFFFHSQKLKKYLPVSIRHRIRQRQGLKLTKRSNQVYVKFGGSAQRNFTPHKTFPSRISETASSFKKIYIYCCIYNYTHIKSIKINKRSFKAGQLTE